MVRLVLIIFFVYTIILSIGSINCIDNNNLVTNQAALFVFGDSLFDAGNNNYINGPEKAWLPLIPPNLQPDNGNNQFTYGVSFASAGAGALAESFLGMVINLGTQLNNFKDVEKSLRSELGDAETKRVFSRAVYLFHIGANDYFYPFSANSSTFQSNSKEKFVDFVIGSCFKPAAELIDMHNKKFPDVLRRLQRQLSGFRYALHDYHTSLSERINSPAKYGFKEGKKACCGSGPLRGINTCGYRIGPSQGYDLCENVTDYLFFDSSHLTEKAHRQIAELIWNGPPNVTRPYNLKALFELN
ncbi:unnamed protein product [Arabidopsis thaliana]|uniref:Uncharacterized protein n=1 Tax=Arabidopsis thaliana TaxID=3702 RepID=A0A5S9WLM9_ARATH|nr:unnamed protein product [Arabidopsis thaliana]